MDSLISFPTSLIPLPCMDALRALHRPPSVCPFSNFLAGSVILILRLLHLLVPDDGAVPSANLNHCILFQDIAHCPVRQLTQCISPYQTQPRWHAAPKNSSPHAILQECCSNHPNVRMPVGFMAKAPSALSEQPSRCGPFLHLSSCQSHDLDPVFF